MDGMKHLRALEALARTFHSGLPSPEELRVALGTERAEREALAGLDVESRFDHARTAPLTPEWFQDQAVALVRAERAHDSEALLDLCDWLFTQERGISTAIVTAQTGRYDDGCAQLVRIATAPDPDRFRRLTALESLYELGALDLFLRTTFQVARDYVALHDFESAALAVGTASSALDEAVEETQCRWRRAAGAPTLLH